MNGVSDASEVKSVGESVRVTSLSACRHEHVVMAYLQKLEGHVKHLRLSGGYKAHGNILSLA